MRRYKGIFLAITSAVLLALAFPLPGAWGMAWVAVVPLFIAIKGKGFLDSFLIGFLAGVVFFYSTISWLNSIAVMATAVLVLYLALYFALFAGLAAFLLKKNLPIFLKCILISLVWVVLEFIRSNLFTGFGWNLLGYSQASFLPAIQIADITGVWGVSFIVMFVNTAIYEFFFTK